MSDLLKEYWENAKCSKLEHVRRLNTLLITGTFPIYYRLKPMQSD